MTALWVAGYVVIGIVVARALVVLHRRRNYASPRGNAAFTSFECAGFAAVWPIIVAAGLVWLFGRIAGGR